MHSLESIKNLQRRGTKIGFIPLSPADDLSKQRPELIDRRTILLPQATEADKDAAYACASMVCLPSAAEAFGMVLVESWTHGVPVIASRIPALTEIVDDGYDGLLVERETTRLASAIASLLENPERAAIMGARGKRKVEERFEWSRIGKDTEAFYEFLCHGVQSPNTCL